MHYRIVYTLKGKLLANSRTLKTFNQPFTKLLIVLSPYLLYRIGFQIQIPKLAKGYIDRFYLNILQQIFLMYNKSKVKVNAKSSCFM